MNEFKSTWQIEFYLHSFPTLAAAKSFVMLNITHLVNHERLNGEKIIHYVDHKPRAEVTIKVLPNRRVSFSRPQLL